MTDTNAMAEQRRARAPHTAAFLRSRPRNPYRVPRPAVISFSGGRTSAYMLRRVIDAYGGRLPEDISVIFANTGMERPETLEFVDVCAHAWAVRIQWVEYFWDAPPACDRHGNPRRSAGLEHVAAPVLSMSRRVSAPVFRSSSRWVILAASLVARTRIGPAGSGRRTGHQAPGSSSRTQTVAR